MALRDYMYAKHTDMEIVNKINATGDHLNVPVEHKPKTFRVIHRSKSPKGRKSAQQQLLQATSGGSSNSSSTSNIAGGSPNNESQTSDLTPPHSPDMAPVEKSLLRHLEDVHDDDSHCTPSTCRKCPNCDRKDSISGAGSGDAQNDKQPRTPASDLALVPIIYQEDVPSTAVHLSTLKLDEVDYTHVY